MAWEKTETWKIVYVPKVMNAGVRGVALVEAATHHDAMVSFRQQYSEEFSVIESCEKLFG
jgi:thiamine monophosphate synthase